MSTRRPTTGRLVFRHHWDAFFAGGLLSLTRLATGFIRVKLTALLLGTAGVGLLSQATQVQLLGITIGSLSIAAGPSYAADRFILLSDYTF